MKRFFLLACLSILLPACSGTSSVTLNQDNFNKIHDDMSQAEVRAILGEPSDSKTDPIPLVGGTQTTYSYHNDTSYVVIVFKNDQVKEKHGNFGNKS